MLPGSFSFSNCYFSNNSNGLSVITVKNSALSFSHCTISDNNMTGITIMEGGLVGFEALNKIQNNRASEGAGIKLLPTTQVYIIGILTNTLDHPLDGPLSLSLPLSLPLAQCYSCYGSWRGISHLLNPAPVTFQHAAAKKKKFFENIFYGSYHTFAVTDSQVFGWGLNNFHQLDSTDTLVYYHPQCLDHVTVPDTSSVMFCGGEHHTLMSCSGDIHIVGRKEYGRLGLGKDKEPKSSSFG